jgi:hypothetical protein
MAKHNNKKELFRLVDWCKENIVSDIILDHDDVSTVIFDDIGKPNMIMIEKNYTYEEKIYLLLHEVGHCKLRQSWFFFTENLRYMANFEAGLIKYKRKNDYFVACLEEEFKAWEFGYLIGKILDIRINDEKWDKLKYNCLTQYINAQKNP